MSGIINIKASAKMECCCSKCGKKELSSTTNMLSTGNIRVEDATTRLDQEIQKMFIDPPIGWSVNGRFADGRLDHRCESCTYTK
jgi:hypothetical protein